MRRRKRARSSLRTIALVGIAAVVAAGCTAGGGSADKAGGSEPVVLKMSITSSSLGYTPPIEYFVHRVSDLSRGDLRIEVIYQWGNFSADAEQQAVLDVKAAKADLTWAGTRVFDTLGVDSFRALQAPMLIDSYALQDAVVKSDIPGQMLRGLDRIGVVGLAVVAASLPKLIAVHHPLLGLADWRGITFQAYRSHDQAEAIRALGAQSTDVLGVLNAGLMNGNIEGFAKSLLAIQLNGTENLAPYVTANVNLWPGTEILLANPGRLSQLTDEQRGWLREAAGDATARSTSMVEHEDQIVAEVCKAGARFANATEADLAALRQAFAPVYASMEQDPQTKAFIASIQALKASTPAGAPLVIPAGCTGSGSGPQTSNDPIAGSWTTAKLTESQVVRAFVAAGGSEKEGHKLFSRLGDGSKHFAVITMTFHEGAFNEYQSGDGRPTVLASARRYIVADDETVTLNDGRPDCIGGVTFRYELKSDTLRLRVVRQCPGGDGPYNTTLYASFPFKRVS